MFFSRPNHSLFVTRELRIVNVASNPHIVNGTLQGMSEVQFQ